MSKQKLQERDEAREELRALLNDNDKVYSIVRHVARSGMSRDISFFVIRDNEPHYITNAIGRACGFRMVDTRGHWALRVGGCGMDMCFHVVDSLALTLWGHEAPRKSLRSESI